MEGCDSRDCGARRSGTEPVLQPAYTGRDASPGGTCTADELCNLEVLPDAGWSYMYN